MADQKGNNASAIRAIARINPAAAPHLCEGIALLKEKRLKPAIRELEEAASGPRPEADRWMIQGFLVRALGQDGQIDRALALSNDTVAQGMKSKRRDATFLFQLDRGYLHATRHDWRKALVDFNAVYKGSSLDALRSPSAFQSLNVAVHMNDMELAAHWYPLVLGPAAKAKNGKILTDATVIYAQMLDERRLFDRSGEAYRRAVPLVQASGDSWALTDLLEYQGQSRFAAGDRSEGEPAYRRVIVAYRQAGREDYVRFLENNLKAMIGRLKYEES
jgi:tetratricopeptide (TPR) repeat protein